MDLLSEASRADWISKEGDFTADCVGFDSSGLHVMVQHNPYLTGESAEESTLSSMINVFD